MLRHLILLAPLAVVCAGCSSGDYKTAPVSGQVTLNGKPVENVEVMFQPVATDKSFNPGPGSYGITDADGRYTLKLIGKETKGAVVGKHKVRIDNHTPPGDPSDDRPVQRPKFAVTIPAKYHLVEAKLEFDVPSGGSTSADFQLTSP